MHKHEKMVSLSTLPQGTIVQFNHPSKGWSAKWRVSRNHGQLITLYGVGGYNRLWARPDRLAYLPNLRSGLLATLGRYVGNGQYAIAAKKVSELFPYGETSIYLGERIRLRRVKRGGKNICVVELVNP